MDANIIASWGKNAAPWVTAVREGEIESRTLVTNRAIVDTVRSLAPATGIDIGCGEGWLVRALDGVAMLGVDVVPGLVDAACQAGGGEFLTMSYEEIAQGRLQLALDVAICNFSLLGDDTVTGLFRAAPSFLRSGGAFVVQTMHPLAACGDAPYRDGWRTGSWIKLHADHGLQLREVREPVHPATGKPVSLVLVGCLPAVPDK